jgi:hypothetical protein
VQGELDFLTVLPLAVVMNAGPQMVSAIFLATSQNARRNSVSFLLGVTVATTAGTALARVVMDGFGSERSGQSSANGPIDYVVIGLLLALVVWVYARRKITKPPAWMGRLQSASPRFSFKLGFLLYLLMPTDVITVFSVGGYLALREAPYWQAIPFIVLTVLIAGIPLGILLLLGDRADIILPKTRAWMTTNAWIVNEVVILFFLAMSISGLE